MYLQVLRAIFVTNPFGQFLAIEFTRYSLNPSIHPSRNEKCLAQTLLTIPGSPQCSTARKASGFDPIEELSATDSVWTVRDSDRWYAMLGKRNGMPPVGSCDLCYEQLFNT